LPITPITVCSFLQAQPTLVKLRGQGKMLGLQNRLLPCLVLALASFLLGWIIQLTRAEEPGAQTKPEEAQAKGAAAGGGSAPAQAFDQAAVGAGMAAFERSCTKCHDAARSLERTKDLAGWRSTVRRMAAKRDANIASGDIEPIAVYLASRNSAASGASGAAGTSETSEAQGGTGAAAGAAAAGAETSSLSTFATLSPQ